MHSLYYMYAYMASDVCIFQPKNRWMDFHEIALDIMAFWLPQTRILNWIRGSHRSDWIFWDVMSWSLLEVHQCFRGTYCLHLEDWRESQVQVTSWLLVWPEEVEEQDHENRVKIAAPW